MYTFAVYPMNAQWKFCPSTYLLTNKVERSSQHCLTVLSLVEIFEKKNCVVLSFADSQEYRIVASTNTCCYSENQIFHFLKSQIVTCRIGIKLFYLWRQKDSEDSDLTNIWCVCQVTFFQLIWTTFIFWPPMLLIEFNSIGNMGCH